MVVFDVVEEILLRSDVKDLLRSKSVCKSWYSLISSPCFVKTHLRLKRTCNDDDYEVGHKRIVMMNMSEEHVLSKWKIVGSSNGLVCVSPFVADGRIFVTNPSTREIRKLPMAPLLPKNIAYALCLSFGYDSTTNDYKVVMGIWKNTNETVIQVLSLKSNVWKLIGQFKYGFYYRRPGILFNGALYWSVLDYNTKDKEYVFISFDLSGEEFIVLPQPDDPRYVFECCCTLGIFQDCLCIFCSEDPSHDKVWVLRNYNAKQSWELLPNDSQIEYGAAAHCMHKFKDSERRCDDNVSFFCDDNSCISRTREYIGAPLFVQSLVSPYDHNGDQATQRITRQRCNIKVVEGEHQYSQINIRKLIINPSEQENREIEEILAKIEGITQKLFV